MVLAITCPAGLGTMPGPSPTVAVVREHAPGWNPEEIQELTEARLIIPDDLREFRMRD